MKRRSYEYGVRVGTIVREIDDHLETLERQLRTRLSGKEEAELRRAYKALKKVRRDVAESLQRAFPTRCQPGEYQPPPPPPMKK
jgi:hypothetical protein